MKETRAADRQKSKSEKQVKRQQQQQQQKSCAKRTQININMYKNALCNAESIKNALHLMAHFCAVHKNRSKNCNGSTKWGEHIESERWTFRILRRPTDRPNQSWTNTVLNLKSQTERKSTTRIKNKIQKKKIRKNAWRKRAESVQNVHNQECQKLRNPKLMCYSSILADRFGAFLAFVFNLTMLGFYVYRGIFQAKFHIC